MSIFCSSNLDILATTWNPTLATLPSEQGHGPTTPRGHYHQSGAVPSPRAAMPVMAPTVLASLYPPMSQSHPVTDRGTISTNPAMAGYHGTAHSSRLPVNTGSLPDIVHSHSVGHALPPRPNQHRSSTSAAAASSRQQRQQQQQQQQQQTDGGNRRNRDGTGGREQAVRSGQQRSRSRTQSTSSSPRQTTTIPESTGSCKEPCLKCLVTVTSLRWVLLALSLMGVLFVVGGIVMAALHAIGNDFLIYALVFIGLGVILVAVVVAAWKCTPPGSEPVHALFRIGNSRPHSARQERHRRRTRRSRSGQWHGGVLYPEFQHRRPPPSYTASMQAYHVQTPDGQSSNIALPAGHRNTDDWSLPGSSPPSYRSRASTIHSGVHIIFPPGRDSAPNSRPPTYRSRSNGHQRPRLPDEFEISSPSTAPADVAFTGPAMNAETVQQIIGTNHQRQQSASGSVWHTRSASLQLPQDPVAAHHRQVPLLARSSTSVTAGTSSQDTGASSQTTGVSASSAGAGLGVSASEATPQSTVNDSAQPADSVQQTTEQAASSLAQSAIVQTTEQPASDLAQSTSARPVSLDSSPRADSRTVQQSGKESVVAQGGTNTSQTVEDNEPEEYNTAL